MVFRTQPFARGYPGQTTPFYGGDEKDRDDGP